MLKNNNSTSTIANKSANECNGSSKIDMSIIERIKSMRSKSRENGDALSVKREETIKKIQEVSIRGIQNEE